MTTSVTSAQQPLSFDDSVLTTMARPTLTALTRDTFALGTLTATELLRVMAERPTPRSVQAPTPQLVVRQSTAPPGEHAGGG